MNKKFFFHVRRVIITPNELKETMNKTLDTSFKGGLMITLSQVLYMNQVNYKHYLYKVCKVIRTEQRHLNLRIKMFSFPGILHNGPGCNILPQKQLFTRKHQPEVGDF